jgi:hypothetical protein
MVRENRKIFEMLPKKAKMKNKRKLFEGEIPSVMKPNRTADDL